MHQETNEKDTKSGQGVTKGAVMYTVSLIKLVEITEDEIGLSFT